MSSHKESQPHLLPPAGPQVIGLTLFLALVLNLFPWPRGLSLLMPDFLLLTLLYWSLNQPGSLGVGIAWVLGLVTDVRMGAVLGQHALVYALACFIALKTYRRVMVFNAKEQAFYALLLLLLLHGIMLMIRITAGNLYPGGWIYFLSSFTTAAFWPAVPAIMQFLRRPTLSSPIP